MQQEASLYLALKFKGNLTHKHPFLQGMFDAKLRKINPWKNYFNRRCGFHRETSCWPRGFQGSRRCLNIQSIDSKKERRLLKWENERKRYGRQLSGGKDLGQCIKPIGYAIKRMIRLSIVAGVISQNASHIL